MEYKVLLAKSNRRAYDITQLVGSTDISDNINKAGICSFTMVSGDVLPAEGNAISVECDGIIYFAGYIFKVDFTEQSIKVTAYDQLRYLKTSDTRVFDNLPMEAIVGQLCSDFGLRTAELEATGYPLGRLIYDGKQLLDIIVNCISLTLLGTGELYYIKDEGGYVVMRNIRSSIGDLVLEPGSWMNGYNYSRSIDDDTYNQIKLVRDNTATGKREVYISKDSDTIRQWGLLQYYEKLDDQTNSAQAKEKADTLLTLKNRTKQSLTLDALGDSSLRAGNILCVRIPDVDLEKFLLCTSAKHSFTNNGHTAKVTLRMV